MRNLFLFAGLAFTAYLSGQAFSKRGHTLPQEFSIHENPLRI